MKNVEKKNKLRSLLKRLAKPRYRGRHVVAVRDRIFTAASGQAALRLLKKLQKKYPSESPLLTYVPKADTLILILP